MEKVLVVPVVVVAEWRKEKRLLVARDMVALRCLAERSWRARGCGESERVENEMQKWRMRWSNQGSGGCGPKS